MTTNTKVVPLEAKAISGIEVKDIEKGEVLARFATLGVVDLDGDIIETNAIGDQKVLVSAWGHGTSFRGELPVGRGTTREKGEDALADLTFFLHTQRGREHFETIKAIDDLGEWSFRYEVKQWRAPTEAERQRGAFRVLQKLRVVHVGPVELGAGVDTATLSAKQAQQLAVKSADPEDPPPPPPAASEEPVESDPPATPPADPPPASEDPPPPPADPPAAPPPPPAPSGDDLSAEVAKMSRASELVAAVSAREEAKRRTGELEEKRQADRAEQAAIADELAKFERTRRKLGAA